MDSQTISNVRIFGFGAAGIICAAYAFATLVGLQLSFLPNWLPIAAGIVASILLVAATLLGGAKATAASLDESYHADRLRAGNLGFWTAIITGVILWQADLGGNMQQAITLTLASAVYLLTHVVLELRGRG